MAATLYGVGAGPGDPELVTRKAWQIVSSAKVVAYLSAAGGGSFARTIMADAISDDAIEIEIPVPMVSGRAPAQSIYDEGAAAIEAQLSSGHDVVMLCEGDPLFYGSFMYVLARLRPRFPTVVIPGVTSMTACAAVHNHALAARNDRLMVIPAPLDDDAIADSIKGVDSAVIIKVGRHLPRIKALLNALGLMEKAFYVSHASLPHEHACPLASAPDEAPYFSIVFLYKGDDPWI